MNDLEPIDIVKKGLGRHGHQYGESLKFRAWIKATLNPLLNIQDVFFDLLNIDLDTAEGVKLDLIGRIVGAPAVVPRSRVLAGFFGWEDQDAALGFGELDDPEAGGYWREVGQPSYGDGILSAEMYKKVIRAQIIKNSSLCTPPDIIKIARMMIDDNIDFRYIERTMTVIIAPSSHLSRYNIELLKLMLPRPSAVGIITVNGYYDDFGFKDQDAALGFGELDDPEAGGYWSTLEDDINQAYSDERVYL